MKKYFKYILILNVIFLYNCQDAIDIQQPGRLTPDVAFENVQDLQDGLIGLYTLLDNRAEVSHATNFTDEVAEGIGGGGQGRGTGHIFNINATSGGPQTIWLQNYTIINRVNRFLEAATLVDGDQATINNIVGQAYAIRAYAHFQLISYFSTDYTDDNALGVIKLDFIPSIADQLLRNTNGEVFDLISSDLATAAGLISAQSSAQFISRDFVTALRARMAAYRGDYTTAEPLARQLLSSYGLASRANFQLMWLDENDDEVIFELARVLNGPYDFQAGWIGINWAFVNATIGGGSFYEFNRALFNLFDPADIRYDAYLAPSAQPSADYQNEPDYFQGDVLTVGKYPGIPGAPLHNSHKIFRSSEMLLIAAEARAAANDLGGVATLIKQLRDARFDTAQPLPTYSNATDAWAAILDERRVEFAFEGHRWKDLKRLGALANKTIERDPLDCSTFNMICTLPITDHRFTLPLPIAEFDGNPGLRAQQNPGY